jgi:hypothetical protein
LQEPACRLLQHEVLRTQKTPRLVRPGRDGFLSYCLFREPVVIVVGNDERAQNSEDGDSEGEGNHGD